MLLSELVQPLIEKRLTGGDVEITGITYDSRMVGPGMLFIAIRGGVFDGHKYIDEAVKRGASAVIVEAEAPSRVPIVIVPDSRAALPVLSARFYGYPSRKIKLVGVTGTNGKTTTTHLIHSIFTTAGMRSGLIGTLGALIGDESADTGHTTPESSDLQRLLADMVAQKVEAAAMEVSSHGLVQHRTDCCEFDCGVFTNLTQDHLDFHHTLEEYLNAKLKLFADYPLHSNKRFIAAVNLDDASAAQVMKATKGDVVTYGMSSGADVLAADVDVSAAGLSFVMTYKGGSRRVELPLGGDFNVYNSLAAASACLGLGLDVATVVEGLRRSRAVPGRFESIDRGQEFGVIVDYAHTPDGLENVLRAARKLTMARLIVVFGCGGDRDRTKRPIMGRIAADLANVVIVTSDNPRTEDPEAIVRDVMEGITSGIQAEAVVDRQEAIERAVMIAEAGDMVVIAGKGHEDYQIFADRTVHFDDREVTREAIKRRSSVRQMP